MIRSQEVKSRIGMRQAEQGPLTRHTPARAHVRTEEGEAKRAQAKLQASGPPTKSQAIGFHSAFHYITSSFAVPLALVRLYLHDCCANMSDSLVETLKATIDKLEKRVVELESRIHNSTSGSGSSGNSSGSDDMRMILIGPPGAGMDIIYPEHDASMRSMLERQVG